MYGLFIIDPPEGRPPADEMVMIMGAYDLETDGENELYALMGFPTIIVTIQFPSIKIN